MQKQIDGVGTASLFKGDPRLPSSDIDTWYQGVLTHVSEPRARAHLWGADAGLCSRRNVLLEHNTWLSNTTTASSNAYMSIGVALEDMLGRSLREKNRLLAQGMYLVEIPDLKIRGKIDLIAYDHEDMLSLIEVKTCGKLPTVANPVHLAQIQTYAAVSGITRCWLTYISRNVATEPWGPGIAMRTFEVDTREEVLKGRLHTAVVSRLASDLKKLTPVPASFRKHTECHYCEFRDSHCWIPRPGLRRPAAYEAEESAVYTEQAAPLYPLDKSPIQDLSIEEYANIELEGNKRSKELMDNILYRKKDTLTKLLEYPLHEELEDKVKNEYQNTLGLILSF
jgi:hypothetical protein